MREVFLKMPMRGLHRMLYILREASVYSGEKDLSCTY